MSVFYTHVHTYVNTPLVACDFRCEITPFPFLLITTRGKKSELYTCMSFASLGIC